ncbi:MAG: glycosyltransferase family 4 protein [Dehalococcoidia bacterium]|nr:glycosyltransferase family 4 protein [Dehalococcoidia bacterium]
MTAVASGTPRVLTWHIHGSYLYYLAQTPCEFIVPVKDGRPEAYGGRGGHFDWPDNVREVPAEEIADLDLDVVLYQAARNYRHDQHEILSDRQRALPRIYLEHDPPREHPTDTRHLVDDPDVLLVHVTAFNDLMWDAARTPTRVIDHGVTVPDDVRYTGRRSRGIVVVNDIATRGRRLGFDVFLRARRQVPLHLAGMGSEGLGGLGDLPREDLLRLEAEHRFFFNPIRYTSLGLAVLEAMMLGLPVVGLATAELATVVQDGVSGYASTDVGRLIDRMRHLCDAPDEAARLGEAARERALDRFNIERFRQDWLQTLTDVANRPARAAAGPRHWQEYER